MSMPELQDAGDEPGLFVPVRPEPRQADKAPNAYRTISEVADELKVPQHVLRFWETKFAQLKPLKRGGGRRYYRPEDVALLKQIHTLLYSRGYTIKGAQKVLKDERAGVEDVMETTSEPLDDSSLAVLRGMLEELKALRALV